VTDGCHRQTPIKDISEALEHLLCFPAWYLSGAASCDNCSGRVVTLDMIDLGYPKDGAYLAVDTPAFREPVEPEEVDWSEETECPI
jgi:hypothetical protein